MNRNVLFLLIGGGILAMLMIGRRLVAPAIETMARAITDFEGWFEGSVSQRNHNPGNLKFASQPGAVGIDAQGHAIFESDEAGWNALVNQIKIMFTGQSRVYAPGMTLREVFSKYAEANSEQYARFVAERLQVSPDTKLSEI